MISEPTSAFVWIWLAESRDPVVCGRLDHIEGRIAFAYARSYLDRPGAVPLYDAELPLRRGYQFPASAQTRGVPLCIDDAMPNSWGRRLVNRRLGELAAEFGDLTYLLESGSDRIGALDFQASATTYVARTVDHATIDELASASERIETGQPLSAALEVALLRGTSIGGARPKALIDGVSAGQPKLIAKFSSTTDTYPVVQAEFVAMELARRAGLDVAPVELTTGLGRRVLLIERFDRTVTGCRRQMISALTILKLTPFPEGRFATYVDLAHQIRARFVSPERTLRELFGRIAFNMLCGNTDDHGRNHAAFVGPELELTPAYDICPQARSGESAEQAMAFDRDGNRDSRLALLLDAADLYLLNRHEASVLIDAMVASIREQWEDVGNLAELTAVERSRLWGRQFLNPHVFET
jgi:serine/threonine-protein kinase HipA